jgi:hypothetical protein
MSIIVLNKTHKPEPDNAHARTVLPNFRGCRCPNEWLTGAYAEFMSQKIVEAANRAGLQVQGEAKITLFGKNDEERAVSGPTHEIVLGASGFAIDLWPRGCLTVVTQAEIMELYGAGLGNLDWCNRDELYNRHAINFLRIMCREVLMVEHLDFSRSRAKRPINTTIDRRKPRKKGLIIYS